MIDQTRALAEKQVKRVRRRLLFQVVAESLLLGWALGFMLTTLWFLVRPFAFAGLGETVRWSVPGVLLGISTAAGLLLAWLRRPNLVVSSMALDEKFELKERVTTLLTLPNEQVDTPVGHALLHDVTEHLTKLRVASEFPLRISWRRLLMPAGALALAVLAAVVDPMLANIKFSNRPPIAEQRKATNIDDKEIQQQLDKLKKIIAERGLRRSSKSEELKELEKEFEKLINQPLEKNGEKIRERINEMRKLEDNMKERMEGLKEKAEKIDAFKKHLKSSAWKKRTLKEGPPRTSKTP